MDRPRHPQVIRPWKLERLKQRGGAPAPRRTKRDASPRNPRSPAPKSGA